jgi:peptide deformylase
MSIRKIIQIGHRALKAKNKEVKNFKSVKIKKLVKDLKKVFDESGLVGLSAPQIGDKIIWSSQKAKNNHH